MSVELSREVIKVNQVIGEDTAQTIVENDIIVPDIKPDVARIILMDGDVSVNDTEVFEKKLVVNGCINYKILYVPEGDQDIKSINLNNNFTHSFEMPDAKQGMKCKARCDIEHTEYNVLNSRKINVKSIVRLSAKAMDEVDKDIVNELGGIEDIQVLKDRAFVNCYLGNNKVNYIIRENLEIPSGKPSMKEILRNDIKISGQDYKITDNKVIVKGDLNIYTLYVADDEERSIQFMEHEIPFTQFIDLPGANENAGCDVEYHVVDSRFELAEDGDGEMRVLSGEISLNILVDGFDRKSVEYISDAYSPQVRFNIEKQPYEIEDVVAENKSQAVLKSVVAVENDGPDITEILNVLCKPVLSECKVLDDKVIIEGLVSANILYLSNSGEQPVSCSRQELPFRQEIELKGIKSHMNHDVNLSIEHCNYSMASSKEVEVRFVIGICFKGIHKVNLPMITKVNEIPVDEKRLLAQPSITIYFTQPGDTLWKIAKRYFTSIGEIQRVNHLNDQDTLMQGKQVIIPKKVY